MSNANEPTSNVWDERFSADHYIYGTDPNDFLREHSIELPKGRVLSLAEGEGRNAVYLAQRGFTVTAIDSSPVAIEKARALATKSRVVIDFICADLDDFEFEANQWDAIVSIFCSTSPACRVALHEKVVQSLKPGGAFLLEAYTPEQASRSTGGGSRPEYMMTAAGLKKELDGLTFKLLREFERDVLEGTHHTGLGSVVQLIAEKPV